MKSDSAIGSIELRHLRYFVAVAEHRNFSRAAVALETAQPSLSQQIRQLENEIGTPLFDRAKRQIELTPAGHEFLGEARRLLAALDVAIVRAREAGLGMRGELRVAYTISATMSFLPAAIRAYRAGHPDVRITLIAMTDTSTLDVLIRGEADAAVMLGRAETRRRTDVDARAIGLLGIELVVPEGHALAGKRGTALTEIGNETLILYARRFGDIHDVVIDLCRARGFVPARVEEVDRIETILGLVAAGEGVSIVPNVYRTLNFPGVAYVAIVPEPEPLAMIVAQAKHAPARSTVAFVETCERVARESEIAYGRRGR